jgi:hypothetical protein
MRNAYKTATRKVEGKRQLERPRHRYGLEKYVGRCGLDSSGSEKGLVVGCCEHVNEPSNSIKGRKFLD